MIAHPDEFAHYWCELLSAAGPCTARRMFGGHGISTGGLTLALVADLGQGQMLWLKAAPDTRGVFEAAGCQRFTYQAKGKARSLSFYSAPVEAMESAREMAPWAHLALQAAIAARQPKKARSRKKKQPSGEKRHPGSHRAIKVSRRRWQYTDNPTATTTHLPLE